jgi:hypothetical protein
VEGWWTLILIFGPVAVAAIIGAGAASALAYWQYGWRGWKAALVFTVMGAGALLATYLAIKYFPTT